MNNPGAFLRRLPEAEAALRVAVPDLLDTASDYEFFSAFCKASDKLAHHRLLLAAKALLAENACKEKIAPDNAERIWLFFAEQPAFQEPKGASFAPDGGFVRPAQTLDLSEFLPLDTLMESVDADDEVSFENALLLAFAKSRKKGVLVDLPEVAYEKKLSLHAVLCALSGKKDVPVLSLQALRVFAQKMIPVLLISEGDGKAAIGFFGRLQKTVGLPPLFWMLSAGSCEMVTDFLLTLGAGACPVLQEAELALIAPRLSYRYPIGNTLLLLQGKCRKSCKND